MLFHALPLNVISCREVSGEGSEVCSDVSNIISHVNCSLFKTHRWESQFLYSYFIPLRSKSALACRQPSSASQAPTVERTVNSLAGGMVAVGKSAVTRTQCCL